MNPQSTLAEERVRLDPGSIVCLYTEGLVEVRGEDLDGGLSRLNEALRTAGASEAALEHLIDEILTRVLSAGPSEDDVALLAMRVTALDPAQLTLRLPAVPSSLPALRYSLRRWLQPLQADTDEAYEITVAASEALTNAVEHAHGPRDASVEVEARWSDGEIEIIVRDRGQWRSPRGMNRGRGLGLMRNLMDAVDLTRVSEGTTVRLRRALRHRATGREIRR